MLIRKKVKEIENKKIEPIADNIVSDNISLLKYLADVNSKLDGEISQDFTLAKLGEKDKTFIREISHVATYVIKQLQLLKSQIKDKDPKIRAEKENIITAYQKAIYKSYMHRVHMLVILNRNVPENPLLEILGQVQREEGEEKKEEEEKDLKGQLKRILKGNSKKKKERDDEE